MNIQISRVLISCIRSTRGVYCFAVVSDSDFISAQYLKNKSMELDQILHMGCHWPDLGWHLLCVNFHKSTTQLWPLVIVKILFPLNIDGIWPNFVYALMLIRSRFGLLRINFRIYTVQLWSLVNVIISFLLNISGTNWWNLTQVLHMY